MDLSSSSPSGATVTDHLPGHSELFAMLEKERLGTAPAKWNSTQKAIVMYGTAAAIMILHRRNFMHRNLGVYTINLDENLEPKLGDVRCARCLEGDFDDEAPWPWAAVLYSAPEANKGSVGLPGDTFALAIVMYQVITGIQPGRTATRAQVIGMYQRGERPPLPSTLDRRLLDLIERCWNQDPAKRPTARDVVSQIESAPAMFGAVDEAAFQAYRDRISPYAECLEVDVRKSLSRGGEFGDKI
jgi:serine/threonine protein kinase